jgi:four helix bundle suffix protein
MTSSLPAHGGYRKLLSFQLARLIFDVTEKFCEKYIPAKSRTRDQMVQAARSAVQNIAEGSQASATSKKIELKLTGIARASLEELKLDYEDFLRQKGLYLWERDDPRRKDLIARRPKTLQDFSRWVHDTRSTSSTESTTSTFSEIVSNGALALINVAGYLLDRQLSAQMEAFCREGGFSERLYRLRKKQRGF